MTNSRRTWRRKSGRFAPNKHFMTTRIAWRQTVSFDCWIIYCDQGRRNGESFGWTISIGGVKDQVWDLAVLGRWDNSPVIGFHESSGSYRDAISGEYDGGEHKGGTVDRDHALSLWRRLEPYAMEGQTSDEQKARRRPIPRHRSSAPQAK